MESRQLAFGLLLLSALLFGAATAVPPQDVRMHDTSPYLGENASLNEDAPVRIVAYENLSERGQELYRKTLKNDGRYWVPLDEGATDYEYYETQSIENEALVIVRPQNTDLPPADEQHQQEHDLLVTTTEDPPLMSGKHLPQVASLLGAILSLVGGLYTFVVR